MSAFHTFTQSGATVAYSSLQHQLTVFNKSAALTMSYSISAWRLARRVIGTRQAPRWMHRNANDAGGVAPQHRAEAFQLQVDDPSGAIGSAHCTKLSCRRQRQCHHRLLMLNLGYIPHCQLICTVASRCGLQPGLCDMASKGFPKMAAPTPSNTPQSIHVMTFQVSLCAASRCSPAHLEQQGGKVQTPDAQAAVPTGCRAHLGPHRESRDAARVHLVHCFDGKSLAADLEHATCSNETALLVRRCFAEGSVQLHSL